jgi:hypothetical protein
VSLEISGVVPDPSVRFRGEGPHGDPLLVSVHSGVVQVGKATRGGLFAGRPPARLGFYVPEAGPFRPSHRITAWAEISVAWTQVGGGDHVAPGPYGAGHVSVELVDDQRGSGSLWPYVRMTVYGAEPMGLRYRVTVTQPVETA